MKLILSSYFGVLQSFTLITVLLLLLLDQPGLVTAQQPSEPFQQQQQQQSTGNSQITDNSLISNSNSATQPQQQKPSIMSNIISPITSLIGIGNNNKTLCGNGVIDEGEECDPGRSVSKECCTLQCKFAPSYFTTCQSGQGVCVLGLCKSRQNQCSAFNGNVLSLSPSVALQGPFSTCNPSPLSSGPSSGIPSVSPIYQSCTAYCAAKNLVNSTVLCMDFSGIGNDPQSLSQDGMSCFSPFSSSPTANSGWGVCQSGTCNTSLCKKYRCNNNGECSSSNTGPKCVCNSGFSGPDCSISSSCNGKLDSCGVCNGDHSTCDNPLNPQQQQQQQQRDTPQIGGSNQDGSKPGSNIPSSIGVGGVNEFFQTEQFRNIVLPAVTCGLGLLLVVGIGTYIYRRHHRSASSARTDSYGNKSVGAFQTKFGLPDGDRTRSIRFSTASATQSQFRKAQAISTAGPSLSTPYNAAGPGGTPSSTMKNGVTGVSVRFDEFRCIHKYEKQMPDEIEIEVGDVLFKLFEYDDGWAKGYNTRTGQEGMYPVGFTERIL